MADTIISNNDIITLVINKLKAKNKYDEQSHTVDVISSYVDEVVQTVKNYCQIPGIYFAMRYIVTNMCTDYVIYDTELAKDVANINLDADPADLSSVKIGDVTVGLGDKYRSNMRKTVLNAHTYDLDSILLDYKSQLNRFRRIW